MSKYFAKYLPMDEEIEKGDWFRYGLHGRYLVQAGPDWDSESLLFYPEAYKVRLFICAVPIAGEECMCFHNFKKVTLYKTEPAGNYAYIEGWTNPQLLSDFGRVVAPISPEAKWVKEGDRFREDEWEIWKRTGFADKVPKDHISIKVILGNPGIWGAYIKLKGPCGHFH